MDDRSWELRDSRDLSREQWMRTRTKIEGTGIEEEGTEVKKWKFW